MKPRATPTNIWKVPAFLPYVQSSLNEDLIAEAESKIGYKLPRGYTELLRIQNGGCIRFELPESVGDVIAGIGPHYPSIMCIDWGDAQHCVSYPLNGLVPFDGDGHWYRCLDYRENPTSPSIASIDIECDCERQIASSFDDFLEQLQLLTENELVLVNDTDVERVRHILTRVMNVDFRIELSNNGVPHYFGASRTGDIQKSVWFMSNRVPRAFVPEDDSRYDELRGLQNGTALMFPELPEDALLLETADQFRNHVIGVCRQSGLELVPIMQYIESI